MENGNVPLVLIGAGDPLSTRPVLYFYLYADLSHYTRLVRTTV